MQRLFGSALAVATLATLSAATVAAAPSGPAAGPGDDVVVIAVIDGSFDPYHVDWLERFMPQSEDRDRSNDLPLDRAPDTWLPGFPDTADFASYQPLELELPIDDSDGRRVLDAGDAEKWEAIEASESGTTHYYWIPDSKVIGYIDFDGGEDRPGGTAHGSGTSSVAAGNIHGTCPECLVVFIDYGDQTTAEAAIEWALDQPWIDVVTNSYGISATPVSRDRVYAGSDTGRQRAASERGQTVLFSAGNGQGNAFVAPNSTLYSSQEGPDWIVTVGAVAPDGGSFTGHGKPADIASLGTSYPSSYCDSFSGCTGNFSGTSNSTPVIAGMYARALSEARQALAGPSRIQQDGVIATGAPVACGAARPECELGDGELTAVELRERLFHGAVHTSQGYFVGALGVGTGDTEPANQEQEFLNEGHGTYFGKLNGNEPWLEEVARIVGPMLGTQDVLARPDGEEDWFLVDSWCRQQIWGEWADGAFVSGEDELPPADADWPIRSALTDNCQPFPGQG